MTIASLIEESIENPPEDQGLASVEGGAVTSPLARARYSAFVNLADTEREEGETPGNIFSIDAINTYHSKIQELSLSGNQIDRRREATQGLEAEIMNSGMSPEATYGTIKELREVIQSGVAAEDLAIQEIAARNVALAEGQVEEAIAIDQAIDTEDQYDVNRQLANVRLALGKELAPTIPGIETALEMFTSWVMNPISGGLNRSGLLESMFDIDIGIAEQFAPGNRIPEVMATIAKMTPKERSEAIKKGHTYISNNAGTLFDNEEDALVMMNLLESLFGTRVQAEAERTKATLGQVADIVLTIATSGAVGAVVRGSKRLSRATPSGSTPSTERGLERLTGAPTETGLARRPLEGELVEEGTELAVRGERRAIGSDAIEGEVVPTSIKGPRGQAKPESGLEAGGTPNATSGLETGGTSKVRGQTYDANGWPSKHSTDTFSTPHTGIPAFSPAHMVNDSAPRVAGPILSDAVTDVSGKIARGLGATRAQITGDTIMPRVWSDTVRRGASLIMPNIMNQLSDAGTNVRNLLHNSRLYTSQELKQVEKNLSSTLNKLSNKDEITLLNKSTPYIDKATGKVSMTYVIGAGGDKSFTTAAQARDFIKRLPTSRLDDFQVLRYEPSTGAYETYEDVGHRLGDYLLRAKYVHSSASGALKENVLRNKTAHFLTNHVSHSVSYIERMSKGISTLEIKQGQASKILNKILKPMRDLSSKTDLDMVWDLLKKAEKNPTDFSHPQLVAMLGGSGVRMQAYKAVRRFYKAVYEIRNLQYRDYLSKKGYLAFTHADGNPAWVRPVRNKSDVETVWWDEAGTIVSRESLEAKGIKIDILENFKPRRAEASDGTLMETPFIAVREGKSGLHPLPAQVLHNKETYLGRHLQTKYVVEEFDTVIVNGKPTKVGRVVAVANNSVDAAREAAKSSTAQARRAINVVETDKSYIAAELDQMHDLQMLTNTKNRMDFEQMDVTRKESIISPMESLDRVANTMSKHVALDEWIEYNTNKWVATYGDLIETKGFPWGGPLSLKGSLANSIEAKARLAQAKKVRERIQLTTGIHDVQIGEKIQDRLLTMGEWMSRNGANISKKTDAGLVRNLQVGAIYKVANVTTRAAGRNFVTDIKSLNTFSFITMNPFRQLLMNASQTSMYAGVEHGSKYLATGKASRDLVFLMVAKRYKDVDTATFNSIIGQYSKLTGLPLNKAYKFYDDFDASATLESVSSHQFLDGGYPSGTGSFTSHAGTYAAKEAPHLAARAGRNALGASKIAVSMTSKAGFQAGESINRIGAYLAIRNKHSINGTLDNLTPTELGVEGLRLSGDMGQYSKAGFQTGAWGIPFQFMSHNSRMLQYMIPHYKYTSWVSSDILSNAEKAKVAVWQAAFFGTTGLGIGSLFRDSAEAVGIEVDPLVQETMEKGIAGMAMQALMEGMAGTDSNINFSESIAPLSGLTGDIQVVLGNGNNASTPVGQAYRILADGATSIGVGFDELTGPTSGSIGNIAGILVNIPKIFTNPVLGVGEKLEATARTVITMLPVLNNIAQARILANTGEHITKSGTRIAQVTWADAMAKGLFGVRSDSVTNAYELSTELRGKSAVLEAPTGKEMSKTGKEFATFTWHQLRQTSNGTMSKQEIMDRIEEGNAALFSAYPDPIDRDIMRVAMRKELIRLAGDRELLTDKLLFLMASDDELHHEKGWAGVRRMVQSLGPSEYGDHMVKEINRIEAQEAEERSKYEAEL